MAATVYGAARHGAVDDSSATGLHVATLTYNYSTEMAQARDSQGFTVAFSLFEDKADITCDGVVKTKTTGLTTDLADTITLANESADTLSLNDQNMFSTPDGAAGTVVTAISLTRTQNDFETGSLTLVYFPLVALA